MPLIKDTPSSFCTCCSPDQHSSCRVDINSEGCLCLPPRGRVSLYHTLLPLHSASGSVPHSRGQLPDRAHCFHQKTVLPSESNSINLPGTSTENDGCSAYSCIIRMNISVLFCWEIVFSEESVKLAVARDRTHGSWHEPPVLYHQAMSTRQITNPHSNISPHHSTANRGMSNQ